MDDFSAAEKRNDAFAAVSRVYTGLLSRFSNSYFNFSVL
jgi:hypothetical protein